MASTLRDMTGRYLLYKAGPELGAVYEVALDFIELTPEEQVAAVKQFAGDEATRLEARLPLIDAAKVATQVDIDELKAVATGKLEATPITVDPLEVI